MQPTDREALAMKRAPFDAEQCPEPAPTFVADAPALSCVNTQARKLGIRAFGVMAIGGNKDMESTAPL
jgi:hypothetical protein